MTRTLLVTGGAGFIGSNFIEFWLEHHPDDTIIVLDALTYAGNPHNFLDEVKNSGHFIFRYGNVLNEELVSDLVSQADIVVHFAAESHVARSIFENKTFYQTDVLGTQVVANAVLKNRTRIERFLHISSSEIYGTAQTVPMTEEHPLNPLTPYASAKAGADRLVYSYWATYDIPAVLVRPFNNYGPRQHLEKVIPRFITNAMQNKPLHIHGDGSARRDWLYVRDTCARLEQIIEAPLQAVKGQAFNIGSGYDLDILSIARMILAYFNRDESLLVHMPDRPGQVQRHVSSTHKAEQVLDVKPARPFEQGLEQTMGWYDQNREWWRPLEWMKEVVIMGPNGSLQHY
ncbi:GDP-mannose 4,6-dehydratase [bacterium]|nr:GDP-mannose 4,6-dehydratase [bacterium]